LGSVRSMHPIEGPTQILPSLCPSICLYTLATSMSLAYSFSQFTVLYQARMITVRSRDQQVPVPVVLAVDDAFALLTIVTGKQQQINAQKWLLLLLLLLFCWRSHQHSVKPSLRSKTGFVSKLTSRDFFNTKVQRRNVFLSFVYNKAVSIGLTMGKSVASCNISGHPVL